MEPKVSDLIGKKNTEALVSGAEKSMKYTIPATAIATIAGGPVAGLAVVSAVPAYSALWELLYGKIKGKEKDKKDLKRFKEAQKEVLRKENLLVFQDHNGHARYIGPPKQDFAVADIAMNILNNTGKAASWVGNQVVRGADRVASKVGPVTENLGKTAKWANKEYYQPLVQSAGSTLTHAISDINPTLGVVAGSAITYMGLPTVKQAAKNLDNKIRNSQFGFLTHRDQERAINQSKYGGFSEGYFISNENPEENQNSLDEFLSFLKLQLDDSTPTLYVSGEDVDKEIYKERIKDFLGEAKFSFLEKSEDFSEGDFGIGSLVGKVAKAAGSKFKDVGTGVAAHFGSKSAQTKMVDAATNKISEGFNKAADSVVKNTNISARVDAANKSLSDAKNTMKGLRKGTPEFENAQRAVDREQMKYDAALNSEKGAIKLESGLRTAGSSISALGQAFPKATYTAGKIAVATMKNQERKAKQQAQANNQAAIAYRNAMGGMG